MDRRSNVTASASSTRGCGEAVEGRPTTPPPAYTTGPRVENASPLAYIAGAEPAQEDSRRSSFDEIPGFIPSPSSSFLLPPPAYTLPPAPYPLSVAEYTRASGWRPVSTVAYIGFVGEAGGEGGEAVEASTPARAVEHLLGAEERARDGSSVASASRNEMSQSSVQERPPAYTVQQPRRPLLTSGWNRTTTKSVALEAGALEIGPMAQETSSSGMPVVVRRPRRRCRCSKTVGAFLLITLVIVVTVVAVRIARGRGW